MKQWFVVYPDGLTHLPFTDSLSEDEARIPTLLAKLLEQLDCDPPALDEPPLSPELDATFGPIAPAKKASGFDELLELVEQLPVEPLTLEEAPPKEFDSLLLQDIAFAKCIGVFATKSIAARTITTPSEMTNFRIKPFLSAAIKAYSKLMLSYFLFGCLMDRQLSSLSSEADSLKAKISSEIFTPEVG
jgi:hypothetical protein